MFPGLLKILVLTALFSSAVFAEADGPDYWRVTEVKSHDVLWMHAESVHTSEKIGKIPYDGVCLKNLGCTSVISFAEFQKLSPAEQKKSADASRWCKVEYNHIVGWVNGKFLSEGGACR
ncbi:MAG: peptide-binding protein [Sulfurovum sp.]|nr:MAG: peptide-binding protein [Sulfurovum sp.]